MYVTATANANGILTLNVTPSATTAGNLGAYSLKLTALADTYQLFRFVKLRCRVLAPAAAAVITWGYSPAHMIATPTTVQQVVELPYSAPLVFIGSPSAPSQPSTWPLTGVPQRLLTASNQLKWYRTQASASVDDVFEYQGMLHATSSASGAITLDIYYEIEVKDFIPPTLTPAKAPLALEAASVGTSVSQEEDYTLVRVPVKRLTGKGVSAP